MGILRDIASDGDKRKQIIDETIHVVDAEVSDKGGLSGMAIKTAYAMVKGLAPGMMQKLVNGLLDDFMGSLDPLYAAPTQQAPAANPPIAGPPTPLATPPPPAPP